MTRIFFLALFMLLPAMRGFSQDTRENADFKLAVNLYNDRVYESAEAQFTLFIEKYPGSTTAVDARYYLGMIQMKLNKTREARGAFQDLALRYPDHARAPEAWWNVAESFVVERHWSEAATAFARIKTFYPKSPRAPEGLLRAAEYFLKAGDEDNARTVLYALQAEYPGSEQVQDAQLLLGHVLVASGDYDRALGEYRRMLTAPLSTPLRQRVLIEIATVYNLLGNKEEAEARLREVLASAPKGPLAVEARLRFGDVQLRHRQFTDAAKSYRLVAEDSTAAQESRRLALQGMAECATAGGDYSLAALTYARIIASLPETGIEPDLLNRAATAAQQVGDFAAAGRYLERLMVDTAGSDRRVTLARLAGNAVFASNPNGATQLFLRYVQDYPNDPGVPFALLQLARIAEGEFRNPARAAEWYQSILDRFVSSAVADEAQLGLARTHAEQGHDQEAMQACRQLITQFPASPYTRTADSLRLAIERFRPARTDETLKALAAVLAVVNEKSGSALADLALADLYLNRLHDAGTALQFTESAQKKGLSGEDASRAAYFTALAQTRLAQAGTLESMKVEQSLRALVLDATGSGFREAAAWELFLLKSEGKPPQAVEAAAMEYLGTQLKTHADEARLHMAHALRIQGRHADAVQEYARIIASRGSDPAMADALYGKAVSQAALGKYSEASEDLRMYERLAPNGRFAGEAMETLAQIQTRIGQYKEAVATRERMIERFAYSPMGDSARLALIDVLLTDKMPDKAAQRLALFLEEQRRHPFVDPDYTAALMYQDAVVAAHRGDPARAKKILMEYTVSFPRGARLGEVYYALGEMFRNEGKTSLAASYLTLASEVQGNTAARKSAAELFMENGRHDDAIREYTRLAETATTVTERAFYRSRIIIAHYRANRPVDAGVAVTAFKTAFPEARDLLMECELEKGKNLFSQRKYDEAMDLFEEVEDSEDKELSALGLYWQGRVFESRGDNQKAEGKFFDVMKEQPGSQGAIEAALSLGRMATRAEKWDIAANNFKLVAEKQGIPSRMVKEALDGLILAYDQLSMYDAAIEMSKRYIAAFPGDPTVFRKNVNMGVFYYQLRYFDQAVTHLQGLLAEAPPDDQAEIRYYIGESYYYKGDFEQASLEFLKVPYLVTKKTEIDWRALSYYMTGQSYEKLSRFSLALEMYQKILGLKDADARDRAQAEKEITRVKTLLK